MVTKKIRIGIGEGAVAKPPGIIVAEGLGSCVALVLYDAIRMVGGMSHIMLPDSPEYKNETHKPETRNQKSNIILPYLYADSAIETLLKELQYRGAHLHNIIAKIVGGACMFPVYNGGSRGIGEQNILYIRDTLKRKLIPLVGGDVGGSHGRTAEFYLDSGRVIVKAVGREDKEI